MWCSIQVVSAVEGYSFDEGGHADNQLDNAYGVALDNAGVINVSNSSKNNFDIFSPEENENAEGASHRSGDGLGGIAPDSAGNVSLTNTERGSIEYNVSSGWEDDYPVLFTATPLSGVAPLTVQFTVTKCPSNVIEWGWRFDNNGWTTHESNEENPTFTYLYPGDYRPDLSYKTEPVPFYPYWQGWGGYVTGGQCRILVNLSVDSITPDAAVLSKTDNVSVTVRGHTFPPIHNEVPDTYTDFYLCNSTLDKSICPQLGTVTISDTEIRATISTANAQAGLYDLVVVTDNHHGEKTATLKNAFRVLPSTTLTVKSITPDAATSTVEDVGVSVRGTGFTSGTTFKLVNATLGTIECLPNTNSRVSDTELRGNLSFADAKEGLYDVVVTAPDGTTDSLDKGFNVTSPWFKPNPDGYQFVNTRISKIPWELFKNIYNLDKDIQYNNGEKGYQASKFYDAQIVNSGGVGTCFGMSATALHLWSEHKSGQTASALGNDPNQGLPSWTLFTSDPHVKTVGQWIVSFHIRSVSKFFLDQLKEYKQYSHFQEYETYRYTYNILKTQMADPIQYREHPYIILYYFNGMQAFHAVIPIRIEDLDAQTHKIVTYDPNHPNQEKYFIYSENAGTMTSPESPQISIMYPVSLDDAEAVPQMPDLTWIEKKANHWIHLLFTNAEGKQLGYSNGEYVEQIPDAIQVTQCSGDSDSPETYYLGNQILKTEIIGDGTGVGSVSIMRPDAIAVINASVKSGSRDEVRVPQSGSSVEYISGSGTDSLQLTLAMDGTDYGRQAMVGGFDVDPSKAVTLSFGTNRDDVSFLNTGSSATVHFSLEQIGTSSGTFVSTRPLTVEAGSSVRIVPSNWGDLHNGNMNVQHDLGNDGSVDYSETFVPGVHLLPLPGYTSSPTDPDGDGLYEDLNGNGALDFNDVVLFFNNMDWIADNEPVSAFDFNKNSQIDFNDIVILFNEM